MIAPVAGVFRRTQLGESRHRHEYLGGLCGCNLYRNAIIAEAL